MFPSNSQLCQRNCGNIASHGHIWWDCPLIRPFWTDILNILNQILDLILPLDHQKILFNFTLKPVGSYKCSPTPHLLNSAKSLIPAFWDQLLILSMRRWLCRVVEVCTTILLTFLRLVTLLVFGYLTHMFAFIDKYIVMYFISVFYFSS